MNTLISPEKEYKRLKSICGLNLEYDQLQEELKHFTALTAGIAGTQIALINLIDQHTQWTLAGQGLNVSQVPREYTVCQYTILNKQPLEIKSLDADKRFKHFDYVAGKGGLNLKYYLGVPIQLESGENLGALCILDREEKQLSAKVINQLKLVARLVAEHLELKKNLNEAKDKLYEEYSRTKKIAHDVRSPITGIQGISSLALDNEMNPEEHAELFEMINNSCAALLDLTEGILKDKEFYGPNELTVGQLATKVLNLYKPQADHKNISFQIQVAPKIEKVPIHKKNLLQIIGNLVSNAIKFTPVGGEVLLSLSFNTVQEQDNLLITVEDSGDNFSTQRIQHILTGKQHSTTGSMGEAGFGLGLQLVNKLVKQRNGTIEVSTGSFSGGKFSVSIPLS